MTSLQEKMTELFGPGHRQIAEIIPGLYISDIACASEDALLEHAGFTHIVSGMFHPECSQRLRLTLHCSVDSSNTLARPFTDYLMQSPQRLL